MLLVLRRNYLVIGLLNCTLSYLSVTQITGLR